LTGVDGLRPGASERDTATRSGSMRVLQVTSYYEPAWAYGGPPRVMAMFARGLVQRGHDVTVFTSDVLDGDHRARPRRELLGGVHVERFPNLSNHLAWTAKKYLPPGLVLATARRIASFDVVHVTDIRTVSTATAHLAARLAGVPLVVSAHGSLPGSTGARGALKRAYDAVFVRPMLKRGPLLLAQTSHEAALFERSGARPEAVRLLPLPVHLAGLPTAVEPGYLRRLGGFSEGVPLVLFLGRIHYLKGLDVLVDSIEHLIRAGRIALAVVGRDDGHWAEVANRHRKLLRSGGIKFLGPLYGTERFAAYADADLFALTPRHWEETSLATLEAAAMGTGLVVTEQADVPGLADAGGGFVVPLDTQEIGAAVVRAIEDPVALGERARALIQRQHSDVIVVDRLEQALREVVAAS